MLSSELNQLLIDNIPEIRHKYYDEISWQEGDLTGSHIIFGDVLCPYIDELLINMAKQDLKKTFDVIEQLLKYNDPYIDEVICFSCLERYINSEYIECIKKVMGSKTKSLFNQLKI